MSSRIKDSLRTKLIAEYIRTGKSPEGYEITENEQSKYRVRKIKSRLELLEEKQVRLAKQLKQVEEDLKSTLDEKNKAETNNETETSNL